jgi:hypothetical protein
LAVAFPPELAKTKGLLLPLRLRSTQAELVRGKFGCWFVWVLRNRRGRSNPSLVPVGKGKGKEATLCEAREGGRGKANKGKTRKEAAPASIIYLKARKA